MISSRGVAFSWVALALIACGGSASREPPERLAVPIPFPPDPCERFQIEYTGFAQPIDDCAPISCPCQSDFLSVHSLAKGCVTSLDCAQFCAESTGAEWACTDGACSADSDCERGDPCLIVPGATIGTCQGEVGGYACIDTGDCASGMHCVAVTETGARSCVEAIEGGGPTECNTNADCTRGHCALPENSFLGFCSTGASGQICARAADCQPGVRCAGQYCTDGSIGSPCTESRDCHAGYCAYGNCYAGEDGDLCNVNDDCQSTICALGIRCSNGAIDATCGMDADCRSGDCASNNGMSACTTGDPGSKCLDAADCRSGDCQHPPGVNPNAVFGTCS